MNKEIENDNNSLPIGSKLLEFEIISILGAGGFGITYKVYDTNLDKMMVIKEYMPVHIASRNNNTTISCISTKEDTFNWGLKRFLEEAKTLSKFDHISIVKAHRLFEANGTAYFVMDFYEGETLESYLSRHQKKHFTQDEILSVMMPIIEGLKAVHAEGFLHRDIAPDNIFLRINKPPILIDFGAARNALGVESQIISAIVKYCYSPPEQYTATSKQDESTDIYAISAVMFEMITNQKPPESTHRQLEDYNGKGDPIVDIKKVYKNRFEHSFLYTISQGLNLKQQDRPDSLVDFERGLRERKKKLKERSISVNNNKILISLIVILLGFMVGGLWYLKTIKDKEIALQEMILKNDKIKKVKLEADRIEAIRIQNKKAKAEADRLEAIRIQNEKAKAEAEADRLEAIRIQNKKVKADADRLEAIRIQNQLEVDRLEAISVKNKVEADRLENIRIKTKREVDRLEAIRIEAKAVKKQNTNTIKYKVINVASNDTLNIRTNPYVTGNNKIGELAYNQRNIDVLETTFNYKNVKWSKISYGNRVGWVVSRCLENQNSHTSKIQKYYRIIRIPSNDTLSVRTGAGTENRKIGDIPYDGRNINIHHCKASNKGSRWCKVSYGFIEGWVSAKYLQKQ